MTENVIIAVVAAVLGAPFLNFIISLLRGPTDNASAIAAGAAGSVQAISDALQGVRNELNEVRGNLATARNEVETVRREAAAQVQDAARQHRLEIAAIRVEHRDEIELIRREHARQMVELEARLRRDGGIPSNRE